MKLLVDTGAWFAVNSRTDSNHRAARTFLRRFEREPVLFHTTDYVIDETVTLLRFRVGHSQAIRFLDGLRESPSVVWHHLTPEWVLAGEKIFCDYQDKHWSFTDCVSMAVMDDLGLDAAFAFDRNFSQYGKLVYPTVTG